MTPEQIADERRRGRRAAALTVAAAALFVASGLWARVLSDDAPERNGPASLRFLDRHSDALIGSSVLRGLALLLLLGVTVHLWRATKIVVGIALAAAASNFTAREFQTIDAADDAVTAVRFIGLLAFSGSLALAFWFIKGCLDAMRIGLLGRFMGITGITMGPGLALPFLAGLFQYLLPVWLIAVAALFAGRAIGGLPPAWEAGEAVTQPSVRPAELGDGPGAAPQRRKRKRRGAE